MGFNPFVTILQYDEELIKTAVRDLILPCTSMIYRMRQEDFERFPKGGFFIKYR